MAGKGETPQVLIEDVTVSNAWDNKACKAVPGWAADALEKGLGRAVDVVRSKPKEGFILRPAIDPVEYDEKKGSLFAQMSVLVMDAGKSVKADARAKGSLGGVDAKSMDKKLKKLIETIAGSCGKEAAAEIASAAGAK